MAAMPASSKRNASSRAESIGRLAPALDRDVAIAGIDPDGDAAWIIPAASLHQVGLRAATVPRMTRLMPLASQYSIVAEIANAAAKLDRDRNRAKDRVELPRH